jgi:beta-ribofuranosylaminobenzene 5'-phosphate synthase
MLKAGAYGAGQSSWGPAVYGLVEDSGAQKLETAVEAFMNETCTQCSIIRTHANNRGAQISAVEDA